MFYIFYGCRGPHDIDSHLDIPINSSHTESYLANVEVAESGLLSLSNCLETFRLNAAINRADAGFFL